MHKPDPARGDPAAPIGVARWLEHAGGCLRRAGIEPARADARLLLAGIAGISTLDAIREPDRLLDPAVSGRLRNALARRLAREPVSRILGSREFYGRPYRVTPATLDPRPETETVIDACLQLVAEAPLAARDPLRIIDVGTGTGCIAITLLAELPRARVVATDISADALAVAAGNASRSNVADRLRLLRTDLALGAGGPFDLLVSNPPYIPAAELASLDPEVRDYDPAAALDGGVDGLAFYRRIAAEIFSIVPDGWTVLEVGAGQSGEVEAVFRHALPPARLREIRRWKDLGGHERVVAIGTRA